MTKTVKFQNEICPYLFKNVYLNTFTIFELSNSRLTKNLIEFNNVTIETDLMCIIILFIVFSYQIDLNEKMLNQHVFKHTMLFNFFGQINLIENDVFKNLEQLLLIKF